MKNIFCDFFKTSEKYIIISFSVIMVSVRIIITEKDILLNNFDKENLDEK